MVLLLPTPSISGSPTALPASLAHRRLPSESKHLPEDEDRPPRAAASGLAPRGHGSAGALRRAAGARSKPLPAQGRDTGSSWGLCPRAGCSELPSGHKGAQVIKASSSAKPLKRYSAKLRSGAAACTPPAPAHAFFFFLIYLFWLPQIRVHRSDISHLPPHSGSLGLSSTIAQAGNN